MSKLHSSTFFKYFQPKENDNNPKLRTLHDQSRPLYGRLELEILIEHYGIEKIYLDKSYSSIILPAEKRNEWRNLRNILKGNYKEKDDYQILGGFFSVTTSFIN